MSVHIRPSLYKHSPTPNEKDLSSGSKKSDGSPSRSAGWVTKPLSLREHAVTQLESGLVKDCNLRAGRGCAFQVRAPEENNVRQDFQRREDGLDADLTRTHLSLVGVARRLRDSNRGFETLAFNISNAETKTKT